MLSHLREASASLPGLSAVEWEQMDNSGLHQAVSAVVRVHTTIQQRAETHGAGSLTAEELLVTQQLGALHPVGRGEKAETGGLSFTDIAALPTRKCDDEVLAELGDAGRTDCVICHEPFALGDMLRTLPGCEHAYHAGCIGHWLGIKAECPLCKACVRPGAKADRA